MGNKDIVVIVISIIVVIVCILFRCVASGGSGHINGVLPLQLWDIER